MDARVGTAVLQGLGLGGVLAVAGVWARLVRGERLPHLGLGAGAGVLALVGLRAAALPAPARIVVVVAAGSALGAALHLVDRRAGRSAPHPRGFGLGADVAALALLVAVAALVRPALSVPLPFGPLGAWSGPVAAGAAAVLGVGGAYALGPAGAWLRGRTARWALAGAVLGLVTVVAAGLGSVQALAVGGVVGVPDTAGLALRAFAVGLAARRGVLDGVVAALGLGVLESLLGVLLPVPGIGTAVTAVAVAAGLVLHLHPWPRSGGRPTAEHGHA